MGNINNALSGNILQETRCFTHTFRHKLSCAPIKKVMWRKKTLNIMARNIMGRTINELSGNILQETRCFTHTIGYVSSCTAIKKKCGKKHTRNFTQHETLWEAHRTNKRGTYMKVRIASPSHVTSIRITQTRREKKKKYSFSQSRWKEGAAFP